MTVPIGPVLDREPRLSVLGWAFDQQHLCDGEILRVGDGEERRGRAHGRASSRRAVMKP